MLPFRLRNSLTPNVPLPTLTLQNGPLPTLTLQNGKQAQHSHQAITLPLIVIELPLHFRLATGKQPPPSQLGALKPPSQRRSPPSLRNHCHRPSLLPLSRSHCPAVASSVPLRQSFGRALFLSCC
ncbi:uncharacterized protein DS421_2g49450 [Arachis hypogaea]|nr:uncharacterized protein DS421_2g49450 [Arachis hypogaea]